MNERKCAGCGEKLSAQSRTGFCARTRDCRTLSQRVCKGYSVEEALSFSLYGNKCRGCGSTLRTDNSTGFCRRNSQCSRLRMNVAKGLVDSIEEALELENGRRLCKNCQKPMTALGKSPFCTSNAKCKRLWSHWIRGKPEEEAMLSEASRSVCLSCNEIKVASHSGNPFCKRSEKCRRLYWNWSDHKNGATPRGELRDPETVTFLYRLFDDRGRTLYVGQTVRRIERRLERHLASNFVEREPWRYEIVGIELLTTVPFKDADTIERAFIRLYGTAIHNKAHRDDSFTPTPERLRELDEAAREQKLGIFLLQYTEHRPQDAGTCHHWHTKQGDLHD